MSSVSNMVYHKFSHVAAFYMLSDKNINIMLESVFNSRHMGASPYVPILFQRETTFVKTQF